MWKRMLNGLEWLGSLGALATDNEDERLQKVVVIYGSSLYAALAIIWGVAYMLLGFPQQGDIPLAYAGISTLNLIAFALGRQFAPYRFVQLLMFLILPFVFQWSMGGFVAGSMMMIWAFASPMTALMASDRREALRWFVGFVALTLVSGVFDSQFAAAGPVVPPLMRLIVLVMNVAGLSMVTFGLLLYFVVERQKARDRSEQLLLNVLPQAIAERLKRNPQIIADQFAEATVLFADVVDFTPHSVDTGPDDVVRVLNDLFSRFDQLAERYNLEKIKTIGDAYMVVGGVPLPRPDHTEAVLRMALDMLDLLEKEPVCWPGGQPVTVRIGVNTGGPVVGAVVGRKKFIYDVWGDMVNVASRMESHGIGGSIQVTEDVYNRLKDRFVFEKRGVIPVKGRGEMTTYLLLRRV